MKELWQEQQDMAEPCPTDFKTKKECDAFFKSAKKPTRLQKRISAENEAFDAKFKSTNGTAMSINRLFDNADAWLDDEPWRKW